MMGRTHLLSGTAACAWFAVAVAPSALPVALLGVGLATAAAMTPDLDHPAARAVSWAGVTGRVVSAVLRLVSRLATGVAHRGLTHSLVFAALLGWGVGWLADLVLNRPDAVFLGQAAAVGVVAALLGDVITRASLRHLFWPFDIRIDLPRWTRLKTDGPAERWLVFPLVVLAALAGLVEVATGGVTLLIGVIHA